MYSGTNSSLTDAQGFVIDRWRSLNSAINDCVHKPRGSRSNEYDERVAALGERAVHTDLRLIDWTPFHSTTVHHRLSPVPVQLIPPHERANIVDIIEHPALTRPASTYSRIFDASRRPAAAPRTAHTSRRVDTQYRPIIARYTVKGRFFSNISRRIPATV